MNPVRCAFIRDVLCRRFGRDARASEPLAGLRLLDVGCGGGILCVCNGARCTTPACLLTSLEQGGAAGAHGSGRAGH